MSEGFDLAMRICNWIFLFVFNVECVMKLFVLGCGGYFKQNWNRFDFAIVVGSNITFVLEFIPGMSNAFDPTVLRFFRIARILRLFKRMPTLLSLLSTLLQSLPSLLNITMLMLLLFFVYAIIGISLFGEEPHEGEFFSDNTNFDDFPASLSTLFRCLTGESWNGVMNELRVQQPIFAPLFFISFVIFGSFVFLNLIIAVILDNFSAIMRANKGTTGIKPHQIDLFRTQWNQLSKGRSYLPIEKLPWLINRLPPPMGFQGMPVSPNDSGGARMIRYIQELDLQSHEAPTEESGPHATERVTFYLETLVAITCTLYSEQDKVLPDHVQHVQQKLFGSIAKKLEMTEHNIDHPAVDAFATIKLSKFVKDFVARWRAAREARLQGDEAGGGGAGGGGDGGGGAAAIIGAAAGGGAGAAGAAEAVDRVSRFATLARLDSKRKVSEAVELTGDALGTATGSKEASFKADGLVAPKSPRGGKGGGGGGGGGAKQESKDGGETKRGDDERGAAAAGGSGGAAGGAAGSAASSPRSGGSPPRGGPPRGWPPRASSSSLSRRALRPSSGGGGGGDSSAMPIVTENPLASSQSFIAAAAGRPAGGGGRGGGGGSTGGAKPKRNAMKRYNSGPD